MAELQLSKPLKYNHPKGTPVTVVDKYTDKQGEEIWFVAPKIEGVYYGKAVNFFENAIKLREKVFKSKGAVNPKDPEQGNAFIDKDAVFDFFTEACSGIILLFASVENLVNYLIENSPNHNYNKNIKNKIFSLGKYSIEIKKNQTLPLDQILFLNIEEKIKKVLPCLYKIEPPVSHNYWQDFKTLKSLRDGFIHCTRNKSYGANKGINSLYSQLFDIDFEKLINSVGDLSTYLKNFQKIV